MYEIKENGQRIINGREIAFYDIECFPNLSMIVFKDIDKNIIHESHTQWNEERKGFYFAEDDLKMITHLAKTRHLVHFNGYWYDDYMLSRMMDDVPAQVLARLNNQIISGVKHYYSVKPEIQSYDTFQQINFGLKKQEAFLGKSIIESSIPFDQQVLSEDEIKETYFYCRHDVDCTIDVYLHREFGYFLPKQSLVDRFPPERQARVIRWNTTTISTTYLLTDPETGKMGRLPRWANIRLKAYDTGEMPLRKDELHQFEMFKYVPRDLADFWIAEIKDKKLPVEAFGLDIVVAGGGIHGVPSNGRREFNNVIFLDVASLYPNIIRLLRALGDYTDTFWSIVTERLQAKRAGDKKKADALKLVINSIYGLLKNEHSKLYNPKASYSVCVFGQIALWNLSERLFDAGCTLVNLNTDGIGFTTNPNDPDCWKKIWHEWEKDFDLTLEDDHFSRLIQKDVNNYLGIHADGSLKAKGGDLKKYDGAYNTNNVSLGIADLCLMNYLMDGTQPIRTILNNLDKPILFQQVLQAGSSKEEGKGFIGTAEFINGERKMTNKVNRIFATKEDNPNRTLLKKVRNENDMVGVKFTDAPDHMIVYNDDLETIENLAEMIDLNYYKALADKSIQRWT